MAGAAENMATDFLLLQRYPDSPAPRFRHYGWHRPAFTFGYAQKIAWVRTQLGTDDPIDLCRRPTGGGIVDHRNDWTYALVIPRGHRLEELRASQSYRAIHDALAGALKCQDVPAELKSVAAEGEDEAAGVCFQRAEVFDVVHAVSGVKIAGAAQKRNKHGLLFQGSIWRPALGREIDWEVFHDDFTSEIGNALQVETSPTPWPDFNEDELSGLTEQYSSAEWLEFR
jgi:lipoate-protein ligase A